MSLIIDYTSGFFEAAPSGETVGTVTGNATLDLTSGNVFNHTPTANTTFVFSNPPASGTGYGFTLKVIGAAVTSGYDIANASYDSVSFSVASQDDNPRSVAFSSDGSKMFMLGTTGDSVYQYSLSTSWDPSSATYDSVSFSVGTQETNSGSIIFKSDGTSFYVIGYGNSVYQYDLTTSYDISTASYASKSLSTGLTNAVGLSISTDGTKLWAADIGGTIQQFTMSTAWDVSTASSDSKSLDVSARGATTTAIYVSPDGSAVYITNLGTDTIYEYDLSTDYDISTGTYNSVSFSVATQETNPWGFTFKDDGSKMYMIGNIGDSVYQYSTGSSTPATIAWPSSVKWAGGTAPSAPANGETDVYTFYTDVGGTNYYGFQAGDAMA
jgi:sugar lactone lactonase YvrE